MNATRLFASALLMIVSVAGQANADGRLYRELDELNNHALMHARDARWEVADHFAGSRDYAGLREDARALTVALRNIEDAIFLERNPHTILAMMDDAHDVLRHFEEHVDRSDIGRVSWTIRRGVRIRPAGYAHVTHLKSILADLHDDVDSMIAVLERADSHHHGHDHGLEVIPDAPFGVAPGAVSPGLGVPGVFIPDLSAETVVPVYRSRIGTVSVEYR
ncbi:MAG: hypothetical protein JNG89_07820 [Planctomycetaceae bacterium]|nr:hypothetical protein [Planctomycetaceae bacterium]